MNTTFVNGSNFTSDDWGSSGGWGPWSRSDEEDTMLLVLAVFASISALTSIYLTIQYFVSYRNRDKTSEVLIYFKVTMSTCCILNLIATLSSSTYILWVMNIEIPTFYALHESHTLRTVTTLSWHLSKVFLFYIFNGKIYYSFLNSLYAYRRITFIGLNVFVSVTLIACLSGALPFAYLPNADPTKQGIGYNIFRYTYIALTLWVLVAFNKRLYALCSFTLQLQPSVEMVNSSSKNKNSKDDDKKQNESTIESPPSPSSPSSPSGASHSGFNSNSDSVEIKCDITSDISTKSNTTTNRSTTMELKQYEDQTNKFMEVLVKNSILWIVITLSNITVGVIYHWGLHWWFIFNAKGKANEVTLSYPLLIQGMDAWINTLCILLTSSFGSAFYDVICKCKRSKVKNKQSTTVGNNGCHGCCEVFCQHCAEKYS